MRYLITEKLSGVVKKRTKVTGKAQTSEAPAPPCDGTWSCFVKATGHHYRLSESDSSWGLLTLEGPRDGAVERQERHFDMEPANTAAQHVCAGWTEKRGPRPFIGGEDPTFKMSIMVKSESGGIEDVFSPCQFTLRPNYCTVIVAHIVTKSKHRRKGHARAAVSIMLLAGAYLNAALFGASTELLEVARDASDDGARLYKSFGMQQGGQGRGHFIMPVSPANAEDVVRRVVHHGKRVLSAEVKVLKLDWREYRDRRAAAGEQRRLAKLQKCLGDVDCSSVSGLLEVQEVLLKRVPAMQAACRNLCAQRQPATKAESECARRGAAYLLMTAAELRSEVSSREWPRGVAAPGPSCPASEVRIALSSWDTARQDVIVGAALTTDCCESEGGESSDSEVSSSEEEEEEEGEKEEGEEEEE